MLRLAIGKTSSGVFQSLSRSQKPAFGLRQVRCMSVNGREIGATIPINIMKNGQDPVIKEDSEYPEWLFTILEEDPSTLLPEDQLTWKRGGRAKLKKQRKAAIKSKNAGV